MIAVSGDKAAKQADFRRSLNAEYSFIADSGGAIIKSFGVKMPVVTLAKRVTFVVGKERKILSVESGKDALDPSGAAAACSLW